MNDQVGDHEVELLVTDIAGATGIQSFTITVANTNDAPIFTSAGDTTATEDSLYSYSIISSDVDEGDELVITASTITGWLQLVDNGDGTGTLEGIPENPDVGDHAVVLRVTDGSGAYAIQSFTITVANTNDAPVFTSEADTTAVEDEVYSYSVTANDVDGGDALELSAPTLPSWLAFSPNDDGTGILSGTPLNANVGDNTVGLRVTDESGAFAVQSFVISVENTNDTPPIVLALTKIVAVAELPDVF